MNKNTPTDNNTPPSLEEGPPEAPGYVPRNASRAGESEDPRAVRSANRARRAQARARRDVRSEQDSLRAGRPAPASATGSEQARPGTGSPVHSILVWGFAAVALIAAAAYLLMPGATILREEGSNDITVNQPIAIAAKPLTKLTKVDVYVGDRLTATHPNPSNPFSVAPPPLTGSERVRIVASLSSALGLSRSQESAYTVSPKPALLEASFNGKIYEPASGAKGPQSAPIRYNDVPSSFKLEAHFDIPVRSVRARGNLDDSFDVALKISGDGTRASTSRPLEFPAGDVSLVELTAVSTKGSVFHRRLAITPLPELAFAGVLTRLASKGDYKLTLSTKSTFSNLGDVADNIRAVIRPFGSSTTKDGTPIHYTIQPQSITFEIKGIQLSQIIDIQILEAKAANGGKLTSPFSLKAYTKSPGDNSEVRFIKGIYLQPDDSGPEGCSANTVDYVGTIWPSNACSGRAAE